MFEKQKDYQADTGIGKRLARVQELMTAIESLEKELDEQKSYLLGHALRNELHCMQYQHMKATVCETTRWIYSDSVKQSEKRLKAKKVREQEDGTAIGNKSQHIRVTFAAKAILAENTKVEA